jgi:hypothetical protein
MAIKISEIEQVFIELFEENDDVVVSSVESIYETVEDEDYLKLVITIHGLSSDDISIIHTKFIFKTDLDKVNLIENTFIYLYDINCVYHKIEFNSILDIKKKIEDIVDSNDFGEDLQILSDFIEAPAMFLNYYMRRENITDYSIFDVQYQPKFKHTPCDKTTFDFKININNQYDMELSIKKIDINDDNSEPDYYKFQFRFMDEIETFETDTLKNFHYFIGSNIAQILDKKLKNK